jgi:general secretion pathway protein M
MTDAVPRGAARAALVSKLDALRSSLSEAWGQRSLREKWLLLGLGALAAGGLLVVSVWSPLRTARDRALDMAHQNDTLLDRIRNAESDLSSQLAASVARPTPQDLAQTSGLAISRVDAEDAQVRLTFEDADFARLMGWLAEIDATGAARIAAVVLERNPEPGHVTATVTLETLP